VTEVRRHQRQTASGKTTTVRQHERNVGGQAWADRVQETTQRGWQVPPAGETPPPPRDDGNWWDDDEATPAGDWWAEDDQQTASCPACGLSLPVNAGGNLAGHKDARDPDRYCTGSGTKQPGRGPAEVKPLPRQAMAEPAPADPMDAAGRRNVDADKAVREAKDEVRKAPHSGSPFTDTPEQAAARRRLREAFDEQDAARAERAEVFDRQMREEAGRRGVPAYESRFARWRRGR
jgi:hypothetical protein